jgi:hypothetical protein
MIPFPSEMTLMCETEAIIIKFSALENEKVFFSLVSLNNLRLAHFQ